MLCCHLERSRKVSFITRPRSSTGYLPAGRQGILKKMKKYYAYVLKSKVDGRLYKGHSEDVEKRLKQHNLGKTKSTRAYRPWELVYFEEFDSREEAITRESYFKTGIGREFLKRKLAT